MGEEAPAAGGFSRHFTHKLTRLPSTKHNGTVE